MTTCLGKSCSFGLLYVSILNVYQFVCVSPFPFGFKGGMWDLIVSIPDIVVLFTFNLLIHSFCYYFTVNVPE